MDIEIVDKEEHELKILIDYLNKNIYSKMSLKDVKEIKETCLEGELISQIRKYTSITSMKAMETMKLEHKREIANYKSIIKGLRNGEENNRHGNKHIGNNRYVGD